MNSRFDDDMEARVVSAAAHYDYAAAGPVMAAPIERDGRVVAYLFHGLDGEAESAGLVSALDSGFHPEGTGHWYGLLGALREREVPAAEAVRSLLGSSGPDSVGRVGGELHRYDGKKALDAQLNPEKAAQQVDARQRRRETTPSISRAMIDAALRGETPLTEPVAEQVAKLDFALAEKPTPEQLVVAFTDAVGRIPDRLGTGTRTREPAFLVTYLAATGQGFPGVDTVVWLQVPAGTPALFQEPQLPGDPGMLLLGRGIEWEADRVFEMGGQTIVTAHVVGREPGALIAA